VATKLGVHLGAGLSRAVLLVHGDVLHGVLDDNTVLDIFSHDSLENAILGWELGDNSEGLSGVDLEARTIVVWGVSVLVRVVSASILVAQASLPALVAGATENTGCTASMRRDLVGTRVGLPDIHLVAANTLSLNVSLRRVRNIKRRGDLYLLHH
jgi:hypothetical protein